MLQEPSSGAVLIEPLRVLPGSDSIIDSPRLLVGQCAQDQLPIREIYPCRRQMTRLAAPCSARFSSADTPVRPILKYYPYIRNRIFHISGPSTGRLLRLPYRPSQNSEPMPATSPDPFPLRCRLDKKHTVVTALLQFDYTLDPSVASARAMHYLLSFWLAGRRWRRFWRRSKLLLSIKRRQRISKTNPCRLRLWLRDPDLQSP